MRPVLELGGPLEVGVALGALGLALGGLELGARLVDRVDRALSVCQRAFISRGGLLQVGELGLERLEARLRGVVVLLLERLPLDLELLDAAVDLVDLDRRGLDLHLQPRGGLVDQVDRLVGQEAVGDVALRQRRGGDDRRVGDVDAVVVLVALLEAAQDRDRVGHVGLADEDGLEAALERGVLLDVLAVLVEGGRADRAQLAAGEHRLEQVGGVDRALGGAGADDRVQLVDEEDDLALGVLDLLEDGLEALLELAAVLRAGEQRADVERDDAAAAQRLGHVAVDDPLREALDDRGLADAGVADQDGVVLRPAREHLDDAADLLVAADHRVELARLGVGGQVLAVLLERLERLLGVGGGDPVRVDDLGGRLRDRVAVGQHVADPGGLVGQRQQDVVGGDVLVAERLHLALGALQDLDEPLGGTDVGSVAPGDRRQLVDPRRGGVLDRYDVGADLPQDRRRETVVLLEDCEEQMGGRVSVLRRCEAMRIAAATASRPIVVKRSDCIGPF